MVAVHGHTLQAAGDLWFELTVHSAGTQSACTDVLTMLRLPVHASLPQLGMHFDLGLLIVATCQSSHSANQQFASFEVNFDGGDR